MMALSTGSLHAQDDEVLRHGVAIVVATMQECVPCTLMKPVARQLALELDGRAVFRFIELEHHRELVEHFAIERFPVVLLMREGVVVDRIQGYDQASALCLRIHLFLGEEPTQTAEWTSFVARLAAAEREFDVAMNAASDVLHPSYEQIRVEFEAFEKAAADKVAAGEWEQQQARSEILGTWRRLRSRFTAEFDAFGEAQERALARYEAAMGGDLSLGQTERKPGQDRVEKIGRPLGDENGRLCAPRRR